MPASKIAFIGLGELERLLDNPEIPLLARNIVRTGISNFQASGPMPLRMAELILDELLTKLISMGESVGADDLTEIERRVEYIKDAIIAVNVSIDKIDINADPQAINEGFTASILRALAERGFIQRDFLVSFVDELPPDIKNLVRAVIADFQRISY